MNNKNIILFIFLVFLNLNLIQGKTLNFNNTIVGNCLNQETPCDLSSKEVWENNQVPIDGDDIIIDFSDISETSSIYLISNSINISLNSFTLNGSDKYNLTSMFILNSNLTVGQFNVDQTNLTFISSISPNKITINNFVSSASYILFSNYTVANFNNFTSSGIFPVNVQSYSQITVSENSNIDSPFYFYGQQHGFVYLMGNTNIGAYFSSIGVLNFGTVTNITYYVEIDTAIIGGILNIDTTLPTAIGKYSFSSFDTTGINLYGQSSFHTNGSSETMVIGKEISIYDSSTLTIPSGLVLSTSSNNNLMSGNIIFSNNSATSELQGFNAEFISIYAFNDIMISNTVIDFLTLNGDSAIGIMGGDNYISTIYCQSGYMEVYQNASITVDTALVKNTDNRGSITIEGLYSGNQINNIYKANIKAINANFMVNVISAGYIEVEGSMANKPFTLLENGGLIINSPFIMNNNFVMENNSTLILNNVTLNQNEAQIDIIGFGYSSTFSTIKVLIYLPVDSNPKSGDEIYISLNPNGKTVSSISKDSVQIYSGADLLSNKQFSIGIDSLGNMNIVFSKNSNNKLIVGVCVGVVGGVVILIAIVAVYLYKKNKRNNHENKSLLKNHY